MMAEREPFIELAEKQEDSKLNSKSNNEESYFFDTAFLLRFIALYRNLSTYSSVGFTVLLLMIVLVQTYVVSLTGQVIGGFYGAIIDKNRPLFISSLEKAAAVITVSAVLDSTVKFLVEILAWKWRLRLCTYMQDRYFGGQLYYKLSAFTQRIDNPDQRITSDIDNFTITLASITQSSISYPVIIGFYGAITYRTIAWFAPLIITCYFIVGYLVTKLFMSRVVNLIFIQERLEGDFRFSHVRVRTFAEAIALLRGDKKEHDVVQQRLTSLLDNKLRIVKWHWSINASSNLFSYSASILNYVIVAMAVFGSQHSRDSAFVAEASFNCIMLVSGFSQIINVATSLADLAGFTARIAHLSEAFNELAKHDQPSTTNPTILQQANELLTPHQLFNAVSTSSPCLPLHHQAYNLASPPYGFIQSIQPPNVNTPSSELNINSDSFSDSDSLSSPRMVQTCFGGIYVFVSGIKFDNVTCFTPNNKVLVRNLSFEVPKGQNMLIVGPSGIGKSSILRILTGLWPSFVGVITKPFPFCWEILHVPQTPYLTRDTLAAQVVYPLTQSLAEGELLALLQMVKLDYLITDNNDNIADWCDILSPGEKQRINLARVFYHRPTYVLLDEATSSLSEDIEAEIYHLLQTYGITVVSIGHRAILKKYHTMLLTICNLENTTCNWNLIKI